MEITEITVVTGETFTIDEVLLNEQESITILDSNGDQYQINKEYIVYVKQT